jgi:hypothetical protein
MRPTSPQYSYNEIPHNPHQAEIWLLSQQQASVSEWSGGVVGYHISLTVHPVTQFREGPGIEPQPDHYLFAFSFFVFGHILLPKQKCLPACRPFVCKVPKLLLGGMVGWYLPFLVVILKARVSKIGLF